MTPREVILAAVRYQDPPYVPWSVLFTKTPAARLAKHFGSADLTRCIHNHTFTFKPPSRKVVEMDPGKFRDMYGSYWDRTIDSDIGSLYHTALSEPTLKGYAFPKCAGMVEETRRLIGPYRKMGLAIRMSHGFTMFERAYAMRGMENMLMDFVEHPEFVHELMDAICEHDLEILDWAAQFKPDIINFGDDWGQQNGLIMSPRQWREFIKPRVARLYRRAREIGAIVSIHCCGDVDELFDELIEIGVQLFNPFQPEVMDTLALKRKYQGRLAFHGGMSIQRILPFGTPDEVRAETRRLLRELGEGGGYVFSPAHDVPADVPLENILAFMDELYKQPGYQ